MDVELIHDKNPRGLGIGGNRLGKCAAKSSSVLCRTNGRRDDFSCRHVEIGDQALCPMPDVFILGALDQAGLQGQGGAARSRAWMPVFSSVLMTCPPC